MVAAPIAMSRTTRCRQLAGLTGVAAVFLCAAWMFGAIALDAGRQVWQGRTSQSWQQAIATVEQSELIVRSGKGKRYIPHVVYRYRANGRVLRSNVIEATPGYYRKQANAVLAAYQTGMRVPVFHDGAGQSVLRQGVRASSWILLILGASACLGMSAILAHLLTYRFRKLQE